VAVVDRVKWDAASNEQLAWKFPSEELKLGTQLIVAPSQEALFIKGGQALDLFGPGTHTLETGNLPLLTRLLKLPFGGATPFTAEVWYVNKTVVRDLKWGTPNPIGVKDYGSNPAGVPVLIHVGASGTWGIRIEDSRSFLTQVVGSVGWRPFTVADVRPQFMGKIVQEFSGSLGEFFRNSRISVFEVAGSLSDLSSFSRERIQPELRKYGIELINFDVMAVSVPDDLRERMEKGALDRLEVDQFGGSTISQGYAAKRSFDILQQAATTPGGTAGTLLAGGMGLGIGLGAGVPAGQQLAQNMTVLPAQASAPPPSGGASADTRLKKLDEALQMGLLTPEEYEAKKRDITAPASDPTVRLRKLKELLDAGLISPDDFETKKAAIIREL